MNDLRIGERILSVYIDKLNIVRAAILICRICTNRLIPIFVLSAFFMRAFR